MPGRGAERSRQRLACTITIDGRRHNGFVLDFSRTGLFIQTSATPAPGDRLDIEVVIQSRQVAMHVEVARRKQVPAQLRTVAHGGLGVRILSAPEEFYQLLAGVQGQGGGNTDTARPARSRAREETAKSKPSSEPKPVAGVKEFRVRVKLGSRTRTLRVSGAHEDAVRREVIEDLGEEWKILDITPV